MLIKDSPKIVPVGFPSQDTIPGNRDRMIQISRRIDWRFLLPEPKLGRVAYCGPREDPLATVLAAFSETLDIIAVTGLENLTHKHQSHFDLLVTRSISFSSLKQALRLIKAGGYLYWEIDRFDVFKRFWLRRASSSCREPEAALHSDGRFLNFQTIESHADFLQQEGLQEIDIYWHRPDFTACREIISLNDFRALQYAFSRSRSDLKGRLKLMAGQILMRSGLWNRLIPCFSLVACRP